MKSVEIAVDVSQPVNAIMGDPDRLQQIIWNLLYNAVKFTPHHGKVEVQLKQSDQNVRGTVVLPHGTGKSKRVVVIAKGEKVREAEQAGADAAGEACARGDAGRA